MKSALHRKMAAGRESVQGTGRSAVRALRLALARSADDVFDLPLSVIGATQSRCGQDGVADRLGTDRLLVLLDGPSGHIGAMSVDRACLSSLIQHQTMGKVTGGETGERPFTGTDAAMVAPLVDEMLGKAAGMSDLRADRECLDGYRFGARAEDMRALLLALDAERFRTFDLTMEFGGGVQQGTLRLVLPEPPEVQENPSDPDSQAAKGPRLDQVIGTAQAELTAVVGRIQVSLSDLTGMVIGDVLPLVQHRMNQTDMVAITGQRIATGRLGQVGGMRAVRMNETVPRAAGSQDETAEFLPSTGVVSAMAKLTGHPSTALALTNANPDRAAPSDPVQMPTISLEDSDQAFLNMSPEEAAAEISQLAGLSLSEEADSEAELT